MLHEHTVKTYEEDLRNLKAKVQRLGRLANEQLDRAMGCVAHPRRQDCEAVVRDDAELDRLEREIDADVLRILALRQPMAVDLREIIAALRISVELERIGDLASNIAKRSSALDVLAIVPPVGGLTDLGRQVGRRLERVLVALSRRDLDDAAAVWRNDSEIDQRYTAIFRETLTYMMEDPRTISAGIHLLFIAKNLERIGDHATNIAEMIAFLVTGRESGEERPKGDASIEVSREIGGSSGP